MLTQHEIRDPIYGFIRVTTGERKLIDTAAFQRLRHIQQLALTNLIYPGGTHKRFEHCLGVMELAGRVYDIVTDPSNLSAEVRSRLSDPLENRAQWRKVVRAAALLHDIGHLPFSHGAEERLFPKGKSHETLTVELLQGPELRQILEGEAFNAKVEQVIKAAVGPKDGAAMNLPFSEWDLIMAEIITGSSFGVDRMDYLMRDSYHCGVSYGRIDYLRLTDCLRILPYAPDGQEGSETMLRLGVTQGGIHSAEALVMARHWMFSQVYFHRLRLLYDHYLSEFVVDWRGQDGYPLTIEGHLELTDNEVNVAMRQAARDSDLPGSRWARRIVSRDHHHRLAAFTVRQSTLHSDDIEQLYQELKAHLGGGDECLRAQRKKDASIDDFPVLMEGGQIYSALSVSRTLKDVPVAFADYLFVEAGKLEEASKWWRQNGLSDERTA